jgi:hypothetical protein
MESRSAMPPAEPGAPPSGQTRPPTDRGLYTVGQLDPVEIDLDGLDDPRALQMLSTEHWSLLATRSLSWNESFSRTGIFLSVLSASVVALGLVGGATQFGREFATFALVLLPVTLFVGIATFVRLDEVNVEDVLWVVGMNRLRHAYVRIKPAIEPFLIAGWTDDDVGIGQTFAMQTAPTRTNTFVHMFVTTPGIVAVIDGVLAASIAGILLSLGEGAGMATVVPVAALVGVVTTGVLFATSIRRTRRVIGRWRPRFPAEPTSDGPGSPQA